MTARSHSPRGDGVRGGQDEVGIVDRLFGVGAEVGDVVAGGGQVAGDQGLVTKSSVIRGNCNSHVALYVTRC